MAELNEQIRKDDTDVVSHHIFMYPFRWDFLPKQKNYHDLNFDERTQISKWDEFLENALWQKQDFIIGERNTSKDYNEFVFFYEHVKKTLYNYCSVEDTENRMHFYNYTFDKSRAFYKIKILPDKKYPSGSEYTLSIEDINLHIFDTGIGILTFNLLNFEKSTNKTDILRINDSGRRIYPQFLGANLVLDTKKSMLADSITVDPVNGKGPFIEDFSFFSDVNKIKNNCTIQLPSFIAKIFDNKGITFTRNIELDSIIIKNIMDDRMFSICWYGNNKLSEEIMSKDSEYPFRKSPWWYCFIFGDRNPDFPTCQNNEELEKYIKNHTYPRWSGIGTFYGVTAETFVCLSEEKSGAKGPPIWDHLTTIYYQMSILCLLQQASILRFSGEASIIGGKLKNKSKENIVEFANLYNNYIEFINKFLFKKVTAQTQGSELYDMLQKFMYIDAAAMDLRHDMQELHNYTNIEQQKSATIESNKLSWLATIFLPASLVLSVFGFSNFPKFDFEHGTFWVWDVGLPIILSVLASACIYFGIKKYRK